MEKQILLLLILSANVAFGQQAPDSSKALECNLYVSNLVFRDADFDLVSFGFIARKSWE